MRCFRDGGSNNHRASLTLSHRYGFYPVRLAVGLNSSTLSARGSLVSCKSRSAVEIGIVCERLRKSSDSSDESAIQRRAIRRACRAFCASAADLHRQRHQPECHARRYQEIAPSAYGSCKGSRLGSAGTRNKVSAGLSKKHIERCLRGVELSGRRWACSGFRRSEILLRKGSARHRPDPHGRVCDAGLYRGSVRSAQIEEFTCPELRSFQSDQLSGSGTPFAAAKIVPTMLPGGHL